MLEWVICWSWCLGMERVRIVDCRFGVDDWDEVREGYVFLKKDWVGEWKRIREKMDCNKMNVWYGFNDSTINRATYLWLWFQSFWSEWIKSNGIEGEGNWLKIWNFGWSSQISSFMILWIYIFIVYIKYMYSIYIHLLSNYQLYINIAIAITITITIKSSNF